MGERQPPPATLGCLFTSGRLGSLYTHSMLRAYVCVCVCVCLGLRCPPFTPHVCPHTCFLSARDSSCAHQNVGLWSRPHCFLYDCLRAAGSLRIHFIMALSFRENLISPAGFLLVIDNSLAKPLEAELNRCECGLNGEAPSSMHCYYSTCEHIDPLFMTPVRWHYTYSVLPWVTSTPNYDLFQFASQHFSFGQPRIHCCLKQVLQNF